MAEPTGPAITLADIAGVDINTVQELRFENLPIMLGQFEVKDSKLEVLGNKQQPAITVECEVLLVESVTGVTEPKESFVGKKHRESFFIKKAEDIGRFKAFVVDAGVQITGPTPLPILLDAIKGMRFPGKIRHQSDPNDKDIKYAHLMPVAPKAG